MPAQLDESAAPSTFRTRLVAFGELRDTILFGSTALYVLGYLTWAVYSGDRGLGLLPPLEGQYFLAGVVPLSLLVGAYALLRSLVPVTIPAEQAKAARIADRLTLLAGVTFTAALIADDWLHASPTITGILFSLGIGGTYAGMGFQIRSGKKGSGWLRGIMHVLIPVLALGAGIFYATRLFPLLPQELGGPSAACVTLDVTRSALAPPTAVDLGAAPADSAATIRTVPLWLHFSGGGILIVSRVSGRPVPRSLRLRDGVVSATIRASGCPVLPAAQDSASAAPSLPHHADTPRP